MPLLCSCHLEFITQPFTMGPRRILTRAKHLLFRDSLEARHERTAGALSEIFASFIIQDGMTSHRELEIVYDFARTVFPEVDHGILGRKLESAVARPQPIAPALRHLKKNLPAEHKTAFALQLYSVVRAGGDLEGERLRFTEVMEAIGPKKLGRAVIVELSQTNAPKSPLLTRVDFGRGSPNEVRLPNDVEAPHFRCYRAGGLILLRNLQEKPLWVRGHSLDADRLLQIRPSDEVIVGNWRLNYEDLVFFLQTEEKGIAPALYLVRDEGELTLSRSKSRLALAKLAFGHRVHLTPLLEGELTDSAHVPLVSGTEYQYNYHDLIHVSDKEPLALESLRRLTQQTGQRFVLPAGRRKVRVSNDPSQLSGDGLLVTPGLAGKFVLEFEFDPTTGLGEFEVIESTQTILANGLPVSSAPLPDGSIIRLSSRQALRCRFSDNILDEERNLVRHLQVENLNHNFWKGGKAIDSLSFQLERGQMMCIIGPSGSGKSTLLEILAGQRSPKSGHVRLNGLSLYERQRRLSPLISFMPQEDALSEKLTAREHLAHAAAIRRPHLSETAIQKRVNYLLGELGLDRIGERHVGSPGSKSLSGGERSRLNAGLDLIGGGEIFLFDEPISGLSSKDAEHVVDALHGFAQDKIVVASLHRPSEKVLEAFDLVLLLDRGGKMAFYGTPQELVAYFTEASKDLKLSAPDGTTRHGADFVFDVLETPMPQLHSTGKMKRRFPPDFWQERFENQRIIAHLSLSRSSQATGGLGLPTAGDQVPAPEPPEHGRRQKWMIFKTHLARAAKSKFRHRGTFYSALLEAPLLAGLIGITLRASAEGSYQFHSALHLPSYLFLAVTVAMFFGLTNSATEVLHDRPVLRRERNCRPHPILYLGSKFLVLTAMVSVQSAVFIAVAHSILDLHHLFWDHLGWMILTGCCGTALALFISVVARSERTALGAIPLILVPQILLAGALIPFKEMNRGLFVGADDGRDQGNEPVPSTIMPLRYAFEGSIVSQATGNRFEQVRQPLQEQIEKLKKLKKLNTGEEEELQKRGEELRVLYAAVATNAKAADLILKDPLAELQRLQEFEDSGGEFDPEEKVRSISQFFVNERVENLVELAETSRLDGRRNDRPNIFLAKEKPFLGFMISTQWYCRVFLIGLIFAFLVPAVCFLKLSLTRR
ncbi:MAG: ABC-type multidrug transport system ATPase subunit [Paracoccaceae bacterium]|jgi:ABC-type multidrug transport system ATPase subunit